jgi:hypothetical protein
VVLADGERVVADLFIDTTPDGRLIGATPGAAPGSTTRTACPATAWPCGKSLPRANPPPLTEFEAIAEGWLRRVPLRGGDAVTLAYASGLTSDDEARDILGGEATIVPLRNGRRERVWSGNCLAIGPAAGQLEPLNGDDAQAIQSGVGRLIALLPTADGSPLAAMEYNRLMAEDRIGPATWPCSATPPPRGPTRCGSRPGGAALPGPGLQAGPVRKPGPRGAVRRGDLRGRRLGRGVPRPRDHCRGVTTGWPTACPPTRPTRPWRGCAA